MTEPSELEIRRPDDWHLHVRDGAMLRAALPFTSRLFARAIIMPNLKPPVRTTHEAATYRERIQAELPDGHDFTPLMTAYLTDDTSPDDLEEGHRQEVFTAVKLYPAGATTNSESGVTDIAKTYRVLERMERIGLPLLMHGEVADSGVDVFDREAVFVERVLEPLRCRFPGLCMVLEHVTTEEAVDYVRAASGNLAATITPHHLMINRNAIFDGGLRPHMYCLPVAKRERHRRALRKAAASGDPRFFFGSDSAPHPAHDKEAECGCAGIFNAPTALECVATVFEEEGALDRLEAFVSLNGARFYGLSPNAGRVKLTRATGPADAPERVHVSETVQVRVFMSGGPLRWTVDWEPGGSSAAAPPDRDHCQPSGG